MIRTLQFYKCRKWCFSDWSLGNEFGDVCVWVLETGFVRDKVVIAYDVIGIREYAKPVSRDPHFLRYLSAP